EQASRRGRAETRLPIACYQYRMMRSLPLHLILPLSALAGGCSSDNRCVEGYGKTSSGLQRGGWDGNGPSLFGTKVELNGERILSGSIGEGRLEVTKDGVKRTIDIVSAEADPTDASRMLYSINVDGEPACAAGEHGVFVRGRYGDATQYGATDD